MTELLQPGRTCWRTATATRAAVILDTQDYFRAAKAAMLNARRSVYLLGWAFDPLTQFTPDPSGSGPKDDRAGPFLRELALRPGLDVRVLIWKSALPVAASQHFFPHRAKACFRDTPAHFRLDESVPFGACHHQKVLVIDDVLAFCGGGDMTTDRWDTTEHLDGDQRRHMPSGGVHDPRHEVMMMVEGPAAAMLGDHCRHRWARSKGEDIAPRDESAPPTPSVWPEGFEPQFHDVRVGLARTEPKWRHEPEVRESEALHLAAIKAARHLIYFENQYFTSPAIGEALAARLEEADGPEVIVVSTEHSPSYFDRATMDKTRSALIRRLQGADRHGRFHAFCPETDAGKTVIVHAKHTIVDDRWLRAGSTNLNNRSAGFDTECDVMIEAGEGDQVSRAAIARHLHRTVGHFFDRSADEVAAAVTQTGSLNGAIDRLDDGPMRRLRRLGPVPIGPLAAVIATFHLGDPVAPTDSWRPWRRRRDLREGLRQLAPELADRPLLTDRKAGVGEGAAAGDHLSAPPKPTLKGEDFMASE
jgi:phosphatidylserine/phosphatidylglycerophosphate/cardiolipin synthase-like enzyme